MATIRAIHRKSSSSESSVDGKLSLKDIAASTVKVIEHGSYEVGVSYDLKEKVNLLKTNTTYYAADSDISDWLSIPKGLVGSKSKVLVTVSECSTLAGARELKERLIRSSLDASAMHKVGVLSFGSAKNPGGGFLSGAQAQVRFSFLFFSFFPAYIVLSNFTFWKRKNRLRAHQRCIPV